LTSALEGGEWSASRPGRFGLDVNTEKTMYMVMFRHKNSEQCGILLIANNSF